MEQMLLRGAATKAGQKKPNRFDACRDLSGRRLRHVNSDGGDSAEKYVVKYREDFAKCMEEVERSLGENIMMILASSNRKRSLKGSETDSKGLQIWFGSEDDCDESEEVKDQKSVTINPGSHSDSSNEAGRSSDLITGGKLDAESPYQDLLGSGSEEEVTIGVQSFKSDQNLDTCEHGDDGMKDSKRLKIWFSEEGEERKFVIVDTRGCSDEETVNQTWTRP